MSLICDNNRACILIFMFFKFFCLETKETKIQGCDKKAKKQIIGLDANLAVKEKKNLSEKEKEDLAKNNLDLVYLVNPLPHSLLNFVFDFGGLEDKDEESYIRCIIEDSIEKIFYNGYFYTSKMLYFFCC